MNNQPDQRSKQFEELCKQEFQLIETWLDAGYGACHFKAANLRLILSDTITARQDEFYDLGAFIIMPNHVHVVVRPLDDDEEALSSIIKAWKRNSSRLVNQAIDSTGALWQPESYDRIVRDAEHLWRVIQYIGKNGRKAGLPAAHFERWINPDWQALGWEFLGK